MRKLAWLVVLALILCTPAMAQDSENPRFEAGGGYSFIRARIGTPAFGTIVPATTVTFDLHGGRGEFVLNANDWIGFVADLGGYKVSDLPAGVDANVFSYMFGPRLSYRKHERVTPFAHALFGGARISGSGTISTGGPPPSSEFVFSGSEHAFAMAVGGGVDVKIHRNVAIRIVQAEYLMTRFQTDIDSAGNTKTATQNNFRIGAGIQFRFGSTR